MYSAVHMCGSFPANRSEPEQEQWLSIKGPDQKQAQESPTPSLDALSQRRVNFNLCL